MSNEFDKEPLPYQIAEWFEHNWIEASIALNGGIVAVATLACSDEIARLIVGPTHTKTVNAIGALVIIASVLFQLFLAYKSHTRSARLSDLRKEVKRLNEKSELRALEIKPLIFAYLKQLGEHDLEFGTKRGQAERLTLYLHNAEKSVFVPISRFSNSPGFSKIARPEYPDNQGCLALAWKNGYHFSSSYPNPAERPDMYVARSAHDGMPKDVVEKLAMKSVLYCGGVIWNKERSKQIGVLMLEATSDRYYGDPTRAFMKKQEQGYLGDLINALG